MKLEIDIDEIVEKMDVKKLVEEDIMSTILDYTKFEDVIDEMLENEETKKILNVKIMGILEEYLSSEEGKRYIIEKFGEHVYDSDLLTDDKVTELLVEFLKRSLIKRL